MTYEELLKIGDEHFLNTADLWFTRDNDLFQNDIIHRFYLAEAPSGAEIICSHEDANGVWFILGSALRTIQPKGFSALATFVDAL